jgi:8-oxo-dGTP diphosphatase
MSEPRPPVRRQRVAAYAVVVRDDRILLTRLAPYLTPEERWTLPGGGIDFGEHPRDAVVREVREETGLDVTVGERAWIDSVHRPPAGANRGEDFHAVRIVYDGAVARDAPAPRVVEEDGSTVDARWFPLADVASGAVPVVALVRDALAAVHPVRRQRLAAYALLTRGETVLLTRISGRGHLPGAWTLPGGGVDHGESPEAALSREVGEETGLRVSVGGLLGVHDVHFTGVAPSGLTEDFHGVHLLYRADVEGGEDGEPRVVEAEGTTDRVAWVPLQEVASGRLEVLDVVRYALGRLDAAPSGRSD